MNKKNEKGYDVKRYYCIYDRIAEDYSDLWSAKNNADALRCFHHTLATQLKNGVITSVDEYDLFFVGEQYTNEKGDYAFYADSHFVYDNEKNNEESEE